MWWTVEMSISKQLLETTLYDAPLSSWKHKPKSHLWHLLHLFGLGPDSAALSKTSCSTKDQAWFKVLVHTGPLRLILDFNNNF